MRTELHLRGVETEDGTPLTLVEAGNTLFRPLRQPAGTSPMPCREVAFDVRNDLVRLYHRAEALNGQAIIHSYLMSQFDFADGTAVIDTYFNGAKKVPRSSLSIILAPTIEETQAFLAEGQSFEPEDIVRGYFITATSQKLGGGERIQRFKFDADDPRRTTLLEDGNIVKFDLDALEDLHRPVRDLVEATNPQFGVANF